MALFSSLKMASQSVTKTFLALLLTTLIGIVFYITHEDGSRLHIPFVDDAMISMQFGRMIADGHGAVWYAGSPRVEGFTNPLSVAYMAVSHALTPSNYLALLVTYFIQCAILFWLWFEVDRYILARENKSPFLSFVTFLCYPIIVWTLGGLEPGLVAVALFGVMRGLLRNNLSELVMYSTLGLLTRMDFAIFLFAFCIRDLLSIQTRGRAMACMSTIAVVLGSLTLARYLYYGELVPNTATLKVSGFPLVDRIKIGVISSAATFFRSFSAPIIALLILRKKPNGYVIVATLFILAYNTYVGGDAWEALEIDNRFLTPVSLALCIEATIALKEVEFKKLQMLTGMAVAVCCTLVAILIARYPSSEPVYETSLQSVPVGYLVVLIAGYLAPLRSIAGTIVVLSVFTLGWQNGFARALGPYIKSPSSEISLVELVDSLTYIDNGAVIAVTHAGLPAYAMDRPLHDLLGKCDKHIARTKSKGLRPGHNKYDYDYSLNKVRPDVVLETYSMNPADLHKAGYKPIKVTTSNSTHIVWLRSDSKYIHR